MNAGGGVVEDFLVQLYKAVCDRDQAGERPQQGGLAGTVGPDEGDDLRCLGPKVDVEIESPELERQARAKGHITPSQRSRSAISATRETVSSTRETAIACSGLLSRRT